jgi:hypothetical protein
MRTRAARFVGTLVIFVIGLSPVGLVGIVPAQETPRPGGELVFVVVPAEPPSFDAHREESVSLIHPAAPHYSEVHYIFTFQWHRIVPHNARLKGWTITPSHFLNNQLDTVWLAPE